MARLAATVQLLVLVLVVSFIAVANVRAAEPVADGVAAPPRCIGPDEGCEQQRWSSSSCEWNSRSTDSAAGTTTRPLPDDPGDVALDGRLIAPAIVEIEPALAAGTQRVRCWIRLRSRRADVTTFELASVGVVGVDADNRSVEYVDADDERFRETGAASWVVPASPELRMGPRDVVDVRIDIDVPEDAPPGGQYAGVSIAPSEATQVAGAPDGGTVGVRSRIVVPVLMRVSGPVERALTLRDLDAPTVRWNRERWTLDGRIINTGNVHATPDGKVEVRSVFGSRIASMPITERVLLPNGGTPLEVTWRRVPWFGIYRATTTVTPAERNGADVRAARDSRWIVALPPWWVAAAMAILPVLLAVGAWHRRRRERAWHERHGDAEPEEEVFPWLG
jgi:hypothetical protein